MENPVLTQAFATDPMRLVPAEKKEQAPAGVCKKCGTNLKLGAEFCHICGRWVYGFNFLRIVKLIRKALNQTGLEIPVLVCISAAAILCIISIFIGIGNTPNTLGEWQIIQLWRIQWLLGTIIVLLIGLLLRKKS